MAFVLPIGLGGAGGVLGGVGTGTGYPVGGEIITFSNIPQIMYTTFIPMRQQHDVPQYMLGSKRIAKNHSLELDVSRD